MGWQSCKKNWYPKKVVCMNIIKKAIEGVRIWLNEIVNDEGCGFKTNKRE